MKKLIAMGAVCLLVGCSQWIESMGFADHEQDYLTVKAVEPVTIPSGLTIEKSDLYDIPAVKTMAETSKPDQLPSLYPPDFLN